MKLLALLAVLAFVPACKKHDDTPPAAGSAAGSAGSAAPVADTADHVVVLGRHQKPKPTDPVRITFDKFRVVKADFDPAHIEGGKATIELDLASLHTDSAKRDDHLKSPSYMDVAQFATITIDIDHVKQQSGSTYTADATVAAHGVTRTYPVTFDVVSTTPDSIRIKGQHTFPRLDFGIGTDPAQNPDESVAPDLTIEMLLTLKKT
ncbi:MAG TPA: YceI family protein [Kofleriaceae bacterium]|nr:YceI family protein [Kofleriaceae bacterium]